MLCLFHIMSVSHGMLLFIFKQFYWRVTLKVGSIRDMWPPLEIKPKEMGQCGLSMPSRSRQMLSSCSLRPQAWRQDMKSLAVSIVRLYSKRLRDLDFSSRLLISSSSSSSSSSRCSLMVSFMVSFTWILYRLSGFQKLKQNLQCLLIHLTGRLCLEWSLIILSLLFSPWIPLHQTH